MQQQPPSGLPHQNVRKTSGLAIGSLVCGIVSFFVPILLSLLAIILGHLSRAKIKKSAGALYGRGIALGGLVCGYMSLFIAIGVISWIICEVKESNRIEKEQIATEIQRGKEIYRLVQKYEADHGKFPDALSELVQKGYIGSLDHLQPTQGGHWIYFKGLSSKSAEYKYFIRSEHHKVVIHVDGSSGSRNLSYTMEPTDFPVRDHESIQE